MASYDFYSDISFPVDVTLDTTIIDTSDAEGLVFLFSYGATSVVELTDGDASDLSDGAIVDAQWLRGDTTFSAAGVGKIGYVGKKRYVKINITNPVVSTSTLALKSMLHYSPELAV